MAYTFSQQQTGMREDGIPIYQNRTQRILNRNAEAERQKQAEIKFNQLKEQANQIRAGITDFEDYKTKYANLSPELKQFFQSPEQVEAGIKAQQQADIGKVQTRAQQLQQQAEIKRQQQAQLNQKASSYSTEDYNRQNRELEISINELNREIDLLQSNISKIEQGYDYNSIIDYAKKKSEYESDVSRQNDIIKSEGGTPDYASNVGSQEWVKQTNAMAKFDAEQNKSYAEQQKYIKEWQEANPTEKLIVTKGGDVLGVESGAYQQSFNVSKYNEMVNKSNARANAPPLISKQTPADILNPEKPIMDSQGNLIGVQSTSFQQTLTLDAYNKNVNDYNNKIRQQDLANEEYYQIQAFKSKGRYTAEELKQQQFRLTAEGGYLPAKLDIASKEAIEWLGEELITKPLSDSYLAKKYGFNAEDIRNIKNPIIPILNIPLIPEVRASDIAKFGLFMPFMETTVAQIPKLNIKSMGRGGNEFIVPESDVEIMAWVRQLEGDVSRSRSVAVVKTGGEKSVVMTDQFVKSLDDVEGKIASETIGKGVSTIIRKKSKSGIDTLDVTQSQTVSRGKAVGPSNVVREGRGQILVDEQYGEGLITKSESTPFRKLIEKVNNFMTEKIVKREVKGFTGPTKSQQGTVILNPLDEEASLFSIKGTTDFDVTKQLLDKQARQIEKSAEGFNQMEITETYKRSLKIEPPLSVKIRGILKVIKDETKEPVYDLTGDFSKLNKPVTFDETGKAGEIDIDAFVNKLDKQTQKNSLKEIYNEPKTELPIQQQALENLKGGNMNAVLEKLERDTEKSADILKSEVRQRNIKASKSFQLSPDIQAEIEFQRETIFKRVESRIVKGKIAKTSAGAGLGSSRFEDLTGMGKIKGLGTTGKFGDLGVFEGRFKGGSLEGVGEEFDTRIKDDLKDEIKLRNDLFQNQSQSQKNQQRFKDETKFRNADIDNVINKFNQQFKLREELKQRQGLKEELKFKQDLNMAPFDFDMNILRGPIPFGLAFGDLWGEPQSKKKLKRKLKEIDILGTTSDFTSKVLGLEPENVSMKDLENKLSRLDSGFGIRRGIKIKW